MIEDTLKKFNNRFKVNENSDFRFQQAFYPTFSFIDTFDGEVFMIQIDSFASDSEIVIENVLNEKIIYKRDSKINDIINGN
jgi:hypothetical protein